MAQVLVRNLDDKVVAGLKKRAQKRGQSLQAEVKRILEEAAEFDPSDAWKAADHIYQKLKKSGRTFTDSTKLIREDRDR